MEVPQQRKTHETGNPYCPECGEELPPVDYGEDACVNAADAFRAARGSTRRLARENFTCPNCGLHVFVYYRLKERERKNRRNLIAVSIGILGILTMAAAYFALR